MSVRLSALGSLNLRDTGGKEFRAVLVQPKRLALFAYLALANPRRLHRRDSLLALFWPESTTEQARRSLRQALHFLRQSLGPDVLTSRGDTEVGIGFDAFWCDVHAFEQAIDAGNPGDALELYRGHLLEGFHVSGVAAEFEQWLEGERTRLRSLAVNAASQLADEAQRAGNPTLAVQWLRALLRIESASETSLTRLMTLLDRAGDRAGALRAYDEFARRLASDFDAEPSPAGRTLAERLRAGPISERVIAAPSAMPSHAVGPHTPPHDSISRLGGGTRARRRWLWAAASALGIAIVSVVGTLVVRSATTSSNPGVGTVLAVGAVQDRTGADSLGAARVLRDLLATDLARVPGVVVVSQDRIQELLARMASGEETPATLTRAARDAGATDVLEGELYNRPGALRLDVRRIDVATGVIRRAYTAEGADVFAIVERLSEQLAAEVGQPSPSPSLSQLTTTSLVARRFYEEGVRAYHQGDIRTALQLFRTALGEDSTFAMAAYFGSRAAAVADRSVLLPLAAQAVRMSRHATERERLLIATQWAAETNSPAYVPLAESLAVRFPLEPDAELALGTALAWSGDFLGAIPHFRRAIDRDSSSLADSAAASGKAARRCPACEAVANLTSAYVAADSAPAAERTARELVHLQPRSGDAWAMLGVTLAGAGRVTDAMAAYRTRQRLWQELSAGDPLDDAFFRAQALIRAGDFATADQLLAERARDGSPLVRSQAFWWQVISFRNQARFGEALEAAKRYRAVADARDVLANLPGAQVLLEMGRVREAAARFAALAAAVRPPQAPRGSPDSALGLMSRTRAWHLTHEATAYAALGDTARLARLSDSVEALGASGAYGRDRRLYHHLRGLLMLARGRREDAVAELERAIYSPTVGYTRTNLELGRTLIALGRPSEAAAALAPALRGDLQSSNYYVTHAELHEGLAQAYEAAGQADSARVHYAWVANAWAASDPRFQARAARARTKAHARARR